MNARSFLTTWRATTLPKPHHTIGDENITASIWKNDGGSRGTYYTFSLSKSYEKDGETKYTTSFGYFDGIRVARITLEAVEWIAAQKPKKDAASKQRSGKRERQAA